MLNASAMLAWLQGEPGGDVVEPLLSQTPMSSANWVDRSITYSVQIEGMQADMEALELGILSFNALAAG